MAEFGRLNEKTSASNETSGPFDPAYIMAVSYVPHQFGKCLLTFRRSPEYGPAAIGKIAGKASASKSESNLPTFLFPLWEQRLCL